MRGRQVEQAFRPALIGVSVLMRLLPYRLRCFSFDLLAGMPGMIGVGARYAVARSLVAEVGNNVYIGRFCTVKNWNQLRIGSNCSLHEYCYVDAKGGISIGDDVSIAHGVSLISFNHSFDQTDRPIRDQPSVPAPIVIDSDVWLGAGCRILSGVRLKSRTVVAAGAVVTQSFDSGVIVGGVPARKLKDLPE